MKPALGTKLLLIGILLTLIPLSIILATAFLQNCKVVRIGEQKSMELAYADLGHIVDNLFTLAESHQEVTPKNIDHSLRVAKDNMSRTGPVTFADEPVAWQAKNQFSNDMLQVATNVISKEGKRAIGSFIPAVNANGNPNPVVAAVLKGETYRGRAFVVNAWYITAYESLYDAGKAVIGMLFVGIPQENVKSLRQAIAGMYIGKTEYVTVLDSTGAVVISPQRRQDGANHKD